MDYKKIYFFLMLLFGVLLLTSFLGGYKDGLETMNNKNVSNLESVESMEKNNNNNNGGFDNYNHYNGSSSSITNGTIFYGPNGSVAKVTTLSDGTQNLQVTINQDSPPVTFVTTKADSSSKDSTEIYYGPNDLKAEFKSLNDGKKVIVITTRDGETIIFNSNENENISPTQYYGSTGSIISSSLNNSVFNSESQDMSPSLPVTQLGGNNAGIPRNQIQEGQEDLYILKSQIVPPICPMCPVTSACPKEESKCPPCKPCGRCPEPSFECKKVPNYNSKNNEFLPVPVLNNFSSFGM